MDLQLTAPQRLSASLRLPASKSVGNRALLIAALSGLEPHVMGLSRSDDTDAMLQALKRDDGDINVGPAGTAMRFLTAYFASRPGCSVTLDGDERMRQRPIGGLVDALRVMGADIRYLGREGYPPLAITGRALHGGDLDMDGSVSSQFVSAVMMVLPTVGGGTIRLRDDIVSAPYLHTTAAVMRAMGAAVDISGPLITVGGGGYCSNDGYIGDYIVETDWSAAAPWYALAALLPGSQLTLEGLTPDSIQGDVRLASLARSLGIATRFDAVGATLDTSRFIDCCCSSFADMNDTPDLAMSWAVLLCLLERSFRMTGLRTLRLKESDRMQALADGLRQLGYVLKVEGPDAVSWYGERVVVTTEPPVIDPCGDHRLAMAFAPAAVRYPGLIIRDAQVVDKSYPSFWRHLERAGFTVTQLAR